MEREFIVKVILSQGYIPLVIKAPSAADALTSFARRSNAEVVGSPEISSELAARGSVGSGDKVFPVVVAAR
jgi:hypothetical protein